MNQVLTALLEKVKGNPIGMVLVAAAWVVYEGGKSLPEAFEPFRTVVMGLGGLLAIAGGAWAGRSKPADKTIAQNDDKPPQGPA